MTPTSRPLAGKKILSQEQVLFVTAFLLLLSKFAYLILQHRLVVHDSFLCFCLQYYFLNHTAVYGEIPQWIPYIAHGTTVLPYAAIHGCKGILFNVLLLTGGLIKNLNFLTVFYLGTFIEELILLIGTWLLSRKLFSSVITVFFVAVSVLGSTVWYSQIYFNLYFYFAIPLILYLLHVFFESGKWRYCFLAAHLFIIQGLSNVPYFMPVIALVVFLYFFFYSVFNHVEMWAQIRNLRFGRNFIICMAMIFVPLLLLWQLFSLTWDPAALISFVSRNPDGSTTLKDYLEYGGQLGLGRWVEALIGDSQHRDYAFYFGSFSAVMVLYALLRCLNRKTLPWFVLVGVLLLTSAGSAVAVFFYHVWPFMYFYRHLFYIGILVKILLCFISGFGLEKLLTNGYPGSGGDRPSRRVGAGGIMLIAGAGVILLIIYAPQRIFALIKSIASGQFDPSAVFFYLEQHMPYINIVMVAAILPLLLLYHIKDRIPRLVVALIIGFHVYNLADYNLSEIRRRTIPLDQEQMQITNFQRLSYNENRGQGDALINPRGAIITGWLLSNSDAHVLYDALLFHDDIDGRFVIRDWQRPLDDIIRAYSGQPVSDNNKMPFMPVKYRMVFPKDHAAVRKFSGLDEKKIQFFSWAYYVADKEKTAKYISDPRFKGDILIVALPGGGADMPVYRDLPPELMPENERLTLPYKVVTFNSNGIRVLVENHLADSVWMFYSDVWHPRWQATVNGTRAKVFKADLAYKAVKLPPGNSEVSFKFSCPELVWLLRFWGLNSLFWLAFIFYQVFNLACGGRRLPLKI